MEEKYSLCALNRIFGFEPKVAHALISHFGSASEIFRTKEKDMDALLGPYSKYKGAINARVFEESAEELTRLSEKGISFLGVTEDCYPDLLRECDDAPLGIYIRSMTPADKLFGSQKGIGVVGTRDISQYGVEWCRRIVQGIGRSSERPAIISGLALGTDICAHVQALDSGLPTIAVMATGPESVYPYRHTSIAERIAGTEGCALITDYPPGTAPLAIHFLRRNRIIAGLSEALILIESRIKGGGMMTSRLAFSYNRDVYALPGRVDDVRSQGCNLLIREKVADAIDSVDGLLDSLGLKSRKRSRILSETDILRERFPDAHQSIITEMTLIIKTVRTNRGINIDDLSAVTGLGYVKTARLAGLLETEGMITSDLLKRYTINTCIYR